MHCFNFCYVLIISIFTHSSAASDAPKKEWLFKDFLRKFDPSVVWEDIESKMELSGRKPNMNDELDNIFKRIDETDELLSLNISKAKGYSYMGKDGRRQWLPPGTYNVKNIDTRHTQDIYYLRPRLIEMAKLAIYQARNKLIPLQMIREKYRTSPLYKMGYLFNKADKSVKHFSLFAYRTQKFCSLYVGYSGRYSALSVLEAHARFLGHLFNYELLIELIRLNDKNCQDYLLQKGKKKQKPNRWFFNK